MTIKLAILADPHGDVHALRDALAQIEKLGCDQIVCAGDLIDWGPASEQTIALIREKRIPCIRGNHDRWALQEGKDWTGVDLTAGAVGFLESLPQSWRANLGGVRVVVWHARPGSDMDGIYADATSGELGGMLDRADADVLIVGHTHEPFCRPLGGGRLVANQGAVLRDPAEPGSVGSPGTFGVLELPSARFTVHLARDGSEVPGLLHHRSSGLSVSAGLATF
jgi:putative phosphoesterase